MKFNELVDSTDWMRTSRSMRLRTDDDEFGDGYEGNGRLRR